MKTYLSVMAVGLAIVMLLVVCVGSVGANCPVSTDSEWNGASDNPPDNFWRTDANWVGSPPSFTNDRVCLHLDDGDDICEYDFTPVINWNLTIFGGSPTFFTFNVTEEIFPSNIDLQDYSSLDVDECVDVVGSTDISGRIKIDVAQAQTEPPGFVPCCLGSAVVEDESATLELTGEVVLTSLTVSADDAGADINMTLDGGGTVLVDSMWIQGETNTGDTARKAAFHLEDGSMTPNELHLWGGQTADRQVGLDLDESMTVRNKTSITIFPGQSGTGGGRVVIDVPIGVTFDAGELVISGGSVLKITGIGINQTFGKVISSPSEEASANSCSCP